MTYRPTASTWILLLALSCAAAAKVRLDLDRQEATRGSGASTAAITAPAWPQGAPKPKHRATGREMALPPPQKVTKTVRALVTACSPHDSEADRSYYARNGYRGRRTAAVAASHPALPHGTLVRIPGYADGGLVRVDAPGGPIIRRARARGIIQLDTKWRTRAEVLRWGSRWLNIEVLS